MHAWLGGGKQELDAVRSAILAANGNRPFTPDIWVLNDVGRQDGTRAFFERVNAGRRPLAIRGLEWGPLSGGTIIRVQQAVFVVVAVAGC